jgi:hypothetical protein
MIPMLLKYLKDKKSKKEQVFIPTCHKRQPRLLHVISIFFLIKIEKKPSMIQKPLPTPVQSVSPRIQTPTPIVTTTPTTTTQPSSNNSSKTIMSQITDSIGFSFFTGSNSSSSGKKKLKIGNPSNVVHTGTSTKQDPSKKKENNKI